MLFWVLHLKCKTRGSFKYHLVFFQKVKIEYLYNIFSLFFYVSDEKKSGLLMHFKRMLGLQFTEYKSERWFFFAFRIKSVLKVPIL